MISSYFYTSYLNLSNLPKVISKSNDLQDKLRKTIALFFSSQSAIPFLSPNEGIIRDLKSANYLWAALALPRSLRTNVNDLLEKAKDESLHRNDKIKAIFNTGFMTFIQGIDFATGLDDLRLVSLVDVAKKIGSIPLFSSVIGSNPTFGGITKNLTFTKNVCVLITTGSSIYDDLKTYNKDEKRTVTNSFLFKMVANVARLLFIGLLVASTIPCLPSFSLTIGQRVLTGKSFTNVMLYFSTTTALLSTLEKETAKLNR